LVKKKELDSSGDRQGVFVWQQGKKKKKKRQLRGGGDFRGELKAPAPGGRDVDQTKGGAGVTKENGERN